MTEVVDAHSDLLLELVHAEDALAEANPLATRWLDDLRAGGVSLQVCALYASPGGDRDAALTALLRQAAAWETALAANPQAVAAVRRPADLDALDGRVGLLLSLEGADSFDGDLRPLDLLAGLGVRMASLTWNERNAFAAGCDHASGLTERGAELVARMGELGVICDLAHASAQTYADVFALAADVAVVVSHAACTRVFDHPRNLDDGQLALLAEAGGVLGLMPHQLVIGGTTLDAFLDHVDHAVAVMGPDHVGLGGDFLAQIATTLGIGAQVVDGVRIDAALNGLAGPRDYPGLAAALARRGHDAEAILGGNLLRFLRGAL